MSMRHEENDIYIIPPNFIDTGTVFGGTIKLRNAAEALILSLQAASGYRGWLPDDR